MEKELVTLITVNYNGWRDTREMINSFYENETYTLYEIIVVDNASSGDDVKILRELFPNVRVVENVNNGFAGGNNAALPYAKGEYIFFINNDTIITAPALKALVERLKSDCNIGGVSPMVKYAMQPDVLQYAGFTPLTPITLRNYQIGHLERDCEKYRVAKPTAALLGTAMIVPRRVIDEVGPMSEVYFLFYEELDWSARIVGAGYELWYEPSSVILHKEGMSAKVGSPLRECYMNRARVFYVRRNLHGYQKVLSLLYILSIATPKRIANHIIKGRIKLATATLKGMLCGCTEHCH